MQLPSRFDFAALCLRGAVAAAGALLVEGCQTDTVLLSPPMHARVVDGVTRSPINDVRVTLVSRDTPQTIIAYSDHAGYIDAPPLVGPAQTILRHLTDTPHTAVHAIFERPGYEPYAIDSVNGYGFFKGYYDVHLYPADRGG